MGHKVLFFRKRTLVAVKQGSVSPKVGTLVGRPHHGPQLEIVRA